MPYRDRLRIFSIADSASHRRGVAALLAQLWKSQGVIQGWGSRLRRQKMLFRLLGCSDHELEDLGFSRPDLLRELHRQSSADCGMLHPGASCCSILNRDIGHCSKPSLLKEQHASQPTASSAMRTVRAGTSHR